MGCLAHDVNIVGCLFCTEVVGVSNRTCFTSLYSGGIDSIEIWFAVQWMSLQTRTRVHMSCWHLVFSLCYSRRNVRSRLLRFQVGSFDLHNKRLCNAERLDSSASWLGIVAWGNEGRKKKAQMEWRKEVQMGQTFVIFTFLVTSICTPPLNSKLGCVTSDKIIVLTSMVDSRHPTVSSALTIVAWRLRGCWFIWLTCLRVGKQGNPENTLVTLHNTGWQVDGSVSRFYAVLPLEYSIKKNLMCLIEKCLGNTYKFSVS